MFLLLLLVGLSNAFAQKTITGKVTDANGEPVLGATIAIKGTTVGTISGIDGTYHLSIPAGVANDTIVFSFIGKTSVMEAIAGRTSISPVLVDDDVAVEEVVVTALGISRKEKTLGYSATKVDADDIANARTSNVADALAGKVAGVQVSATSSNVGALSNMVIRGYSSINGSNQPLYVVDGIPITNTSTTSGDVALATSGISNISANDIESLTILKGAAATALYGSRAANGVVVITTKNGKNKEGKKFNIEYNGSVKARKVSYFPELQNEFGQGWNGRQTFIENGSWGAKFDGSTQVYGPIYNGQQLAHVYSALENNIKDFFEIGWSQSHDISFSGVSEDSKVNYYVSYSNNSDNNIFPGDNDTYKRNTITYRSSYKATDWLKISSGVNFAKFKTKGIPTGQGTTVIDGLYEFPRDISVVDLEDLSNVFSTPVAYYTPYGITNPYWVLNNIVYDVDGKEVMGKLQADINPIKDLTLTYRFSFDYSDNDRKYSNPKIDNDVSLMWDDNGYSPTHVNQSGFLTEIFYKRHEINHDVLANYSKKFLEDKLDISATAGLNVNERFRRYMLGTVNDLSIKTGFVNLANGASKEALEEYEEKRRLVGVLGDVTVGWDDTYFLGYSARNDWSSTLPQSNNSYFYQGITASWLFSNLLPSNKVLTFGKLRLAYGTTGNDAKPYCTTDYYEQAYARAYYGGDSNVAQFPIKGVNAYQKATTAGNANLKPEMTHEFEIGSNLQFYNGRIGFDFAFYKRNTEDQTFQLPVDPASGYSYMYVNYGEVENKGFELLVNTTPIKLKGWVWTVDFNYAKNYNKVLSLPKELDGGKTLINQFGAGDDVLKMYAEEGKPFGVFYGVYAETDPEGHVIVDENGLPILEKNERYSGKSIQPQWTGGATTSLSWKGITLSAALDVSYGGYMLSRTKNIMTFTGNGINTTYNSRNPFVIPNSVTEVDGQYVVNTTPVAMTTGTFQEYFDGKGGIVGGSEGQYLVSRTYAKVRNITLSYVLPKSLVTPLHLSDVSVSVFCNNAFIFTDKSNKFIDPENTSYADLGDLAAQFGETYCNPSCRIFGFNLGIKF